MKFAAIIILYHPEQAILLSNITELDKAGWQVIIIDNSPDPHQHWMPASIHYRHYRDNIGIAGAQNIGLELAQKLGNAYAMLLDQDSRLNQNLLETIRNRVIEANKLYPNLAAYGPSIVSEFDNQVVRARVQRPQEDEHGFLKSKQLIASGKVIPLKVLGHIGLMDEGLFIDGVDHEWCWRAQLHGFVIISDKNAQLLHRQGDDRKRVLGITFKVGSPVRLYYQYRNILVLLRRSHVPLYWKLRNCLALPLRWVVNGYFLDQGRARRKYILQGLKDGWRKRQGRYQADR